MPENKELYKKTLFIFRRDYRLQDNTGLISALRNSKEVIPIFIFTPEQIKNNPYKSDNAVQFMIESLKDLDDDLKKKKSRLFYFYDKPHKIVENLLKKDKDIEAVYVNTDYTPYSIKRDTSIMKICDNYEADFHSFSDCLLNSIKDILTTMGKTYTKFTPYFNKAKKIKVRDEQRNNFNNYTSSRTKLPGEYKSNVDNFYEYNKNIAVNGGRKNALKVLKNIKDFKNYNKERNILSINTTKLSAYIKFGCVSIREVYHTFKEKLGSNNDLIKQLYWRDFYHNIMYAYPKVAEPKNFNDKYKKIPWITLDKANKKEKEYFNAWKKGETGIPIIDACMRELNETGFMHNRGRLIVASFLTKNLLWSWIEGEKYFSNKLVDIDLSNNNGNWQWVAGSGVDAQPYFRVFNPWTQGKDYDEDCEYIKTWVSELKNVPAKDIHEWYNTYENYDIDYPEPIVDTKVTAKKAIEKFKKALN